MIIAKVHKVSINWPFDFGGDKWGIVTSMKKDYTSDT